MSRTLLRRRFIALYIVLALAVVLGGCQPKATPTAVPKAPIKIAIIGAMSGTNAVLGDWMKKGVTLAVDERNAAGGVCGRQIEIVIYDDEADPTKSVNLATKVCTEDKVVAAWATTNSTSALADIPIFEQYKVVQITNGTNVQITQKGSKYIFRSCPAGTAYEYPLVEFLVTKMTDNYYYFEKHQFVPAQGRIALTERPGFGIEFDPARVEKQTPVKW